MSTHRERLERDVARSRDRLLLGVASALEFLLVEAYRSTPEDATRAELDRSMVAARLAGTLRGRMDGLAHDTELLSREDP